MWKSIVKAYKAWRTDGDTDRPRTLALNRTHAYEQIEEIWTAVFHTQRIPYTFPVLRTWATEGIATISELPIPKGKRARAWSMLVDVYWKSLYPEWNGYDVTAGGAPPVDRTADGERDP